MMLPRQVAQGNLSGAFLSYDNPFDPRSPWSMVIALLPETVPVEFWLTRIQTAPLSYSEGPDEIDFDSEQFIRQACKDAGWKMDALKGDANDIAVVQDFFTQCRVRQTEAKSGYLDWLDWTHSSWYAAVPHVLKLFRGRTGSRMSLSEFESLNPHQVIALIMDDVDQANLYEHVQILVKPYLNYHGKMELLAEWVRNQELSDIVPLAPVPEVTPSILRLCYEAKCSYWPVVKDIALALPNATVQNPAEPAIYEDVLEATPEALEMVGRIADTARIMVGYDTTLGQLARWSFAPASVQKCLLKKYCTEFMDWGRVQRELDTLSKTILRALSSEFIKQIIVGRALASSKFSFLKTFHVPSKDFERKVLELRPGLKDGSVSLEQFSKAIGMIQSSKSQEVAEARELASTLLKAQDLGIDPHLAYSGSIQILLDKIFAENARAYKRFQEIVDLLTSLNQLSVALQEVEEVYIRQQCIDAALAYGDFDAACKLVDTIEDPSGWICLLQVGKYSSPDWESKPSSVFQKQREILRKCILISEQYNLPQVMGAWKVLESSPVGGSRDEERTKLRKRDQLQKMLVNGIGWAIGAK